MRLWRLEALSYLGYRCNQSLIIRAETEIKARKLAQDYGAAECYENPRYWLNSADTSCEEISVEGPEEILCVDNSGE